MPYTKSQVRLFNARCQKGDKDMCKLAKEANALPLKKKKGAK